MSTVGFSEATTTREFDRATFEPIHDSPPSEKRETEAAEEFLHEGYETPTKGDALYDRHSPLDLGRSSISLKKLIEFTSNLDGGNEENLQPLLRCNEELAEIFTKAHGAQQELLASKDAARDSASQSPASDILHLENRIKSELDPHLENAEKLKAQIADFQDSLSGRIADFATKVFKFKGTPLLNPLTIFKLKDVSTFLGEIDLVFGFPEANKEALKELLDEVESLHSILQENKDTALQAGDLEDRIGSEIDPHIEHADKLITQIKGFQKVITAKIAKAAQKAMTFKKGHRRRNSDAFVGNMHAPKTRSASCPTLNLRNFGLEKLSDALEEESTKVQATPRRTRRLPRVSSFSSTLETFSEVGEAENTVVPPVRPRRSSAPSLNLASLAEVSDEETSSESTS